MRRLVLDTNILIGLLMHPENYAERLAAFDEVIMSPTVLGEYRAGLFQTKAGRANRAALEAYLQNPAVHVLPITDATARLYAQVFQALKAKGTPIPVNDIWIAAFALEQGACLATDDTHFNLVPLLQVV